MITKFLDALARPVEGFGREELTVVQEEQLTRLAAGELEAEERSALVPLLLRNEVAMEFLVRLAA